MTPQEQKVTRSEQREAARAKAREMREASQKSDRRKRGLKQFAVVALILGLLAGVGAIVVNQINQVPVTPSDTINYPHNMTWNNGIQIGKDFKVINNPNVVNGAAPTGTPTPTPITTVPNITVYLDYQCPVCGKFEEAQHAQLSDWVKLGAATVEIHPVAFLDGYRDNYSTNFSQNVANAAVCVADQAPNSFFNYSAYLYANQMPEGGAGPSDSQLLQWAKDSGVGSASSAVETCIKSKKFVPWVLFEATKYIKDRTNKDYASHWFEQIPGWTTPPGKGTPLVLINNQTVQPATAIFDEAAFAQAVLRAAVLK